MLFSPQPRLKLYTRPLFYLYTLKNLLFPYSDQEIKKAEKAICDYTGTKNAIVTSMGRTALYEGLRVLLKPGDEIILSPLTVPEVISLVILAGLKPVFCDVRSGTWNMDSRGIEELITDKTKAVMTTHLYGFANNVDKIQTICNKHNLKLVEDSAQALSTRFQDNMTGTIGSFGIYSFSYPKNISTFYGGVLVTNDNDLADKVRSNISQYDPLDKKWYYKRVISSLIKDIATMGIVYPLISMHIIKAAYKYNIKSLKKFVEVNLPPSFFNELPSSYAKQPSGLQGKIVCKKLPNLELESQHRINAALLYNEGLKDIEEITLPPYKNDFSHTYLYYPIEVIDRHKLMHFMIENNHDVALQHIPNCADLPEFKEFYRDCPNAHRAAEHTLTLPTYPKYRLDEVEKNIAAIRAFYHA